MLRTVHSLLRLMSGGRILCVVETPSHQTSATVAGETDRTGHQGF